MAQNPVVTITMENGDVIKAELYPEKAPNTVNNFISLVKKGYYDGALGRDMFGVRRKEDVTAAKEVDRKSVV